MYPTPQDTAAHQLAVECGGYFICYALAWHGQPGTGHTSTERAIRLRRRGIWDFRCIVRGSVGAVRMPRGASAWKASRP